MNQRLKLQWLTWLSGLVWLSWDSRLSDPVFLPTWMGMIVILGVLWLSLRPLTWNIPRTEGVLMLFIAWVWLSTWWAANTGEAILNNWRWTIFLGTSIIMRLWLTSASPHFGLFSRSLSIVTVLYFGATTCTLLWHSLTSTGHNPYDFIYPSGHKSVAAAIILLLLALNFLVSDSKASIRWLFFLWGSGLLFFLQSRTAFLGWLILLATAVVVEGTASLKSSRTLRYNLMATTFLVLTFLLVFRHHPMVQRFNPAVFFYSETAQHRLLAWQKTLVLVYDHPLTGVGSGNWKVDLASTGVHPYWLNPEVDREWIFTRAHNDWLEIAAEQGLPGGLMYMLYFAFLVIQAGKIPSRRHRYYALAGLGIYALTAALDFPKERAELTLLLSALTALIHHHHPVKTYRLPGLKAGLGLLVLAAIVYGTWRYFHEVKLKQLLQARVNGDHAGVLSLLPATASPWYSLDFSATPLAWYGGVAAFELKQYPQALNYFQQAHQVHPYAHQVLNNLGSSYWQLGDTIQAIKWYERCLALHPAFEDPRFNLAVILAGRQEYQKAEKLLIPVTRDTIRKNEFLQIIQEQRNEKKDGN